MFAGSLAVLVVVGLFIWFTWWLFCLILSLLFLIMLCFDVLIGWRYGCGVWCFC